MFDAKSLLERVAGNAQDDASAPGGPAASPGMQSALSDLAARFGVAPESGLSGLIDKLKAETGGAGGVLDSLGQVFGQAAAGTREGAGRIGQALGADDLVKQLSGGQSSEELLAKLKDLAANNQLATGTALGGLGTLILGTQGGRSLAGSAGKLGALALIGGLAYKAYQNYQAGRPLVGGGKGSVKAAPKGSGFEPQAASNESAALLLKTMIAAANADGRIDDTERQRIMGVLATGGSEAEGETFLKEQLAHPASVDDIAAAVTSPEEGVKVYTAARLAISSDTPAEDAFLARLAEALGLDKELTDHLDAEAKRAAA